MKAKLILENGREIEMELTEEQAKLVKKWPQIGDKYWYLNAAAGACDATHTGDDINRRIAECGNVFETEQRAENMSRALRLIEAVRQDRLKLNGDWKPNWSEPTNWSIWSIHKILSNSLIGLASNKLYADTFGFYQSRDDVNSIIEKHRDDLLWYFNEFLPERG